MRNSSLGQTGRRQFILGAAATGAGMVLATAATSQQSAGSAAAKQGSVTLKDGVKTTENLVKTAFFTKSFPADKLDWVIEQNLKFPRGAAAKLLVDSCCQDWRDVIPRIDIPTIVFGATKSLFNPRSQRWIASQIPGARAHIFEESEGGSHFMFMENPQKFNNILLDFLA
jgi:non-heme chloroperoxidase